MFIEFCIYVYNIISSQRQHPVVSIASNISQLTYSTTNSEMMLHVHILAPSLLAIATSPLSLSIYLSISLMTSLCTFRTSYYMPSWLFFSLDLLFFLPSVTGKHSCFSLLLTWLCVKSGEYIYICRRFLWRDRTCPRWNAKSGLAIPVGLIL